MINIVLPLSLSLYLFNLARHYCIETIQYVGLGASDDTRKVTADRLSSGNGYFTTREVAVRTGGIFFASASDKYGTTLRCRDRNGLGIR